MATSVINFRPTRVLAAASVSGNNPSRRKRSDGSGWWTPLFGWSSEPDYIESSSETAKDRSGPVQDVKRSNRTRFNPGCFTEDKAKQLRLLTKETQSFHDAMYHSAIASRLASDFKDRSDP